MNTSSRALYERLLAADSPLLLDVRKETEFTHWKVEGPSVVDALNIPYFEFIEDEAGSTAKVVRWIAGRDRDLIVVCAKGGSSEFVADLLCSRGIQARNLEGGMIAWGAETAVRQIASSGVSAWQVQRFGKGCLSYIIACGPDAVVVDPHRRIDAYRELLRERALTLRGVFDTHLHADHVSGAPELVRAEEVPYYAGPADFEGAPFEIAPCEDGSSLKLGRLEVTPLRFLHAPGHTPGSTVLLVDDGLLLTGDTLFVGGVGRPDLAGMAEAWARDLYRTLHERLARVPDGALVLPAHTSGTREMSADGTIAEQLGTLRRNNHALWLDEDAFVRKAREHLVPAPAHYAKIRAINVGAAVAAEEELIEIELGKNECAMSRRS